MGPFGSNSFALCPLSAVWMVTLRLEKKFNQFEHHSQLQWHQIELHTYDSTTEPRDICLLCAWFSGLYLEENMELTHIQFAILPVSKSNRRHISVLGLTFFNLPSQ